MALYRLIAPQWLLDKDTTLPKTIEGRLTLKEVEKYNEQGYNCYYFPNTSSTYAHGSVKGSDIDTFSTVFVDFDLKSKAYASKEDFYQTLGAFELTPSRVVDSGNGIHAYWKVSDLDAMSYLKLSRRLMRYFNTDEATQKLAQLMRVPGTMNTKVEGAFLPCVEVATNDNIYSSEQLDKALPSISMKDDDYCKHHFNSCYGVSEGFQLSDKMPAKFGELLNTNKEAKKLWLSDTDDRSKRDYRFAHLMLAAEFSKEEAMTVLANSAKAVTRHPHHQMSYAKNIVDKLWTYEEANDVLDLSMSVRDILSKGEGTVKGKRFPCHPWIDNTVHGFRLGQVLGLVAGSGVGKTAFALNAFRWFVQSNPDYVHFFIPLEQPVNEIADRWRTMCGTDTTLQDKVHIISNYDETGSFRHLSFSDIKEYLLKYQRVTGKKIGCVVIDHIGALNKEGSLTVEDICHSMKAFAVQTNTFLIMQSQTSREKAGIGDLELDKDAAYGTVFFESYCDYLVTLWQPVKRCHKDPACPTVTAFKFCKIRHKKAKKDGIQEDVPYWLFFDSDTELLRHLTQLEKESFDFFLKTATNKRKADKKTDLVIYQSTPTEGTDGTDNNRQDRRH